MKHKNAFTIAEIIVSLAIIGALVAVSLPNLTPAVNSALIKDACNDLRAISAAQQNYMEHHNYAYYTSGSCSVLDINTNLGLNIAAKGTTFCCTLNTKDSCTATVPGFSSLTVQSSLCGK